MTAQKLIEALEHSAEGKKCPGVIAVLKALADVPADVPAKPKKK